MAPLGGAQPALRAFVVAALLGLGLGPGIARAEGLLEAVSGNIETRYSLISTKTRDTTAGTTTRNETSTYDTRFTFKLNQDLFPKVNLNAGGTYEEILSYFSGNAGSGETRLSLLRPYAWLTLRDPVLLAAVGYDRQDDTTRNSGQPATSLIRDTYSTNLTWRPDALPMTQFRYTHTETRDDPRASVDTRENFYFLKSEYLYRGLQVYYAGTYRDTEDLIRDVQSTELTHEGKLAYSTTLLDGRLSITSDNRVRVTELENTTALSIPPVAGLSIIDDAPLNDTLATNPALVDGDKTTSAGLNIGYPGPGGDFRRRHVGLDFLTPVAVSSLQVWVDGFGTSPLPSDITNFFSWDVYTSTDNLTWALHTTIPVAAFGPFDRRFELNFAAVTTRYIKVVTRPLPGGIIGTTDSSLFPSIVITELQAFVDQQPQQVTRTTTQIVQNYNLSIRALLFRTPSLSYHFDGYYYQTDPGAQSRYNISNGLFLTQQLGPIFSTSANASLELGKEGEETRTAVLYYASLAATPLRTLTDTLVLSGNRQWVGKATTTTDSVVLYNTAQLYRGIDASLSLGAVFASDDPVDSPSTSRRDLYVNLGTGVTPHPSLTLTLYYLGKLSRSSGGATGGSRDTTQNRLDVGLSFSPFRTLFFSASASIVAETGTDTRTIQNYGLSWSPFPDGNLQLSLSYAENYLPEHTRIVRPSVRWYITSKRRSYLEASYEFSTTDTDAVRSTSQLFSTSLKVYF